jgi:hypothetical protein
LFEVTKRLQYEINPPIDKRRKFMWILEVISSGGNRKHERSLNKTKTRNLLVEPHLELGIYWEQL